jgi:hypothetical protein
MIDGACRSASSTPGQNPIHHHILPSASLSGIPDGKNRCNGIYEPIHGKFLLISSQYYVDENRMEHS